MANEHKRIHPSNPINICTLLKMNRINIWKSYMRQRKWKYNLTRNQRVWTCLTHSSKELVWRPKRTKITGRQPRNNRKCLTLLSGAPRTWLEYSEASSRRYRQDPSEQAHQWMGIRWRLPQTICRHGSSCYKRDFTSYTCYNRHPETTTKGRPQPITLQGRQVVVPGDCHIALNGPAVHRHPRHWPCVLDGQGQNTSNDLDQFKRLVDANDSSSASNTGHPVNFDDQDMRGPSGWCLPFSNLQGIIHSI